MRRQSGVGRPSPASAVLRQIEINNLVQLHTEIEVRLRELGFILGNTPNGPTMGLMSMRNAQSIEEALGTPGVPMTVKKTHKISPEGRARIAAASRKRWAAIKKQKAANSTGKASVKAKRATAHLRVPSRPAAPKPPEVDLSFDDLTG